jgi:FtsH-binding integral membrane protein
MDLIDHLVSLGLQVSSLLGVAAYIRCVQHPRVRRHRWRRGIIVLATLGLVVFIGSQFAAWGLFVNARHPTLVNGKPVKER